MSDNTNQYLTDTCISSYRLIIGYTHQLSVIADEACEKACHMSYWLNIG